MPYTVTFTSIAEQHLAAAWLASSNRSAVTRAAHEIGRLLALDPLAIGEGRESSVNRVEQVTPLGFAYDVIVDDTAVFVTAIWLLR